MWIFWREELAHKCRLKTEAEFLNSPCVLSVLSVAVHIILCPLPREY
jgi:hypothetical protein